MLDWEITEQESLPPSAPEEDVRPPRPPRKFWIGVLLVLVVVVAGVGGFTWWRLVQGERTLERDLLTQIRAEEAARLFGNRDRVPFLITEEVPRDWRTRFANQFITPDGEATPVEISIERLTVTGLQADVYVRLGNQVQRRAYEQTAQGWRRIPLGLESPQFGDIASFSEGESTFRYRRSDDQFVIQLAQDLPALTEMLEAWRGEVIQGTAQPLFPPQIAIQPEELSAPLLEQSNSDPLGPTIFLNSPQVVYVPPEWNISGESAIRAQLAQLLWTNVPIQRFNAGSLPGANRFATALQIVMALRWALDDEEYQALVATWQSQSASIEWQSPFSPLNPPGGAIEPFAPNDAAVALFLTADRLLTARDLTPERITEIRTMLANADNWDVFFGTVAGPSTLAFESAVRNIVTPAPLTIPFRGSVANVDNANPGRGIIVTVAGHPTPVIVDELLWASELLLPDGTIVNGRCASLFQELEIEGEWREVGMRLTPSRITVSNPTLAALFTEAPPPADAIAYLGVYTNTPGSMISGLTHITALSADGTTTTVLTPSAGNVTPMAGMGWGTNVSTTGMFLTIPGDQGCNAQWYLRYVPGQGIVGAWLVPNLPESPLSFFSPVWDDLSNRGLMVRISNRGADSATTPMPFWWLDEGEPQILGEPDGYLPGGVGYLLSPNASMAVVYQLILQGESEQVTLLGVDLATQEEVMRYEPPTTEYAIVDFAFSPVGDAFYVAWQIPNPVDYSIQSSGSVLQRIDVATGVATEWFTEETGTIFFIAPDLRSPNIYAMTFVASAINSDEAGVLLVRFTEEDRTILDNGGDAFGISTVLRCGSGGILYLRLDTPTEQETRYELDPRYLHRVGGQAEDLVFPVPATQIPLMCP